MLIHVAAAVRILCPYKGSFLSFAFCSLRMNPAGVSSFRWMCSSQRTSYSIMVPSCQWGRGGTPRCQCSVRAAAFAKKVIASQPADAHRPPSVRQFCRAPPQ